MTQSPVTPVVARAIAAGDPDELIALLTGQVRLATLDRFHEVMQQREQVPLQGPPAERELEAAIHRLETWARSLSELAANGPERTRPDDRSGLPVRIPLPRS
jgi:hypothetical protein